MPLHGQSPSQSLLLQFLVFLCAFILILTVPLSLLLFLPYRWTVMALARAFRPDLGPILRGMNASVALDNLGHPKYNVVLSFLVNQPISLDRLREAFKENVLFKKTPDGRGIFYPELQQTYGSFLGFPFRKWEREKFRLEAHIRDYDYLQELPFASNPPGEEDLRENFGGWLALGWQPDFPPWEFLRIPRFQGDKGEGERMAVVFRAHHILGDGVSLTNLIMDYCQGNIFDPFAQGHFPGRKASTGIFGKLLKIPRAFAFPVEAVWDLAGNLLESHDPENCWRVGRKLSKDFWTSFTPSIPMSVIKDIKNRHEVSYTAVLFTALCGGIRRFMTNQGLPLPRSFTCYNPVPIPGRPPGLTNHISFLFIRLPLRTKSPIVRLHKIDSKLRKLSGTPVPLAINMLINFMGIMPSFYGRLIHGKNTCTGVTSIFPVAPGQPAFDGVDVLETIAGIPLGPGQQGISFLIMGTGGKFRMVANIDKTLCPSSQDFRLLGDYIYEELMWLYNSNLFHEKSLERIV